MKSLPLKHVLAQSGYDQTNLLRIEPQQLPVEIKWLIYQISSFIFHIRIVHISYMVMKLIISNF